MAQTVALARSSATCYANGSTRATIFTNSASYTSTRVIVNSFVVWNSTVPYYTDSMKTGGSLTLLPSGQKGALLARIGIVNGSSSASVIPYSNANMPFGAVSPGATTTYSASYFTFYSTNTTPQKTFDNMTNNDLITQTNTLTNLFPANFYMGPSDSLIWLPNTSPSNYPKFSGFTTQTIYYNFTLIHES